uniref:Ribosome-binding factor A, mitochondrial n=1 Tax=Parascaris univalens TaxID=6257 RepID=A0A915AL17_PARUN
MQAFCQAIRVRKFVRRPLQNGCERRIAMFARKVRRQNQTSDISVDAHLYFSCPTSRFSIRVISLKICIDNRHNRQMGIIVRYSGFFLCFICNVSE